MATTDNIEVRNPKFTIIKTEKITLDLRYRFLWKNVDKSIGTVRVVDQNYYFLIIYAIQNDYLTQNENYQIFKTYLLYNINNITPKRTIAHVKRISTNYLLCQNELFL